MDHLSDVIEVTLGLVVLPLDLVDLLLLHIEFVLLRREVLVQVYLDVLLRGELLLHLQLLAAAFLQLRFRLEELLLLLHGLLHHFSALQQFALHVFDFLEELLLLGLFLLLLLVLLF